MVVALHLVECYVLVACELQHTPEIGLLLIAPEEFQFAVTGDDDDGRCVGTDVGEWGILVDGGLQGRNALLFTDVVVRDALTAEGNSPYYIYRKIYYLLIFFYK